MMDETREGNQRVCEGNDEAGYSLTPKTWKSIALNELYMVQEEERMTLLVIRNSARGDVCVGGVEPRRDSMLGSKYF